MNWFQKLKGQQGYKVFTIGGSIAFGIWGIYDLITYGTITLSTLGFFGGAAILFFGAAYLFRNNV